MTINEFCSDPDLMTGYSAWLRNPVTVMLLDMARDYRHPVPLKPATGETALYHYGQIEGANLILTLLTKMEDLVKQQAASDMLAEPPSYGAEKVKERYER